MILTPIQNRVEMCKHFSHYHICIRSATYIPHVCLIAIINQVKRTSHGHLILQYKQTWPPRKYRVFEGLLTYVISGPVSKWRWWRSVILQAGILSIAIINQVQRTSHSHLILQHKQTLPPRKQRSTNNIHHFRTCK